MKNQIVLQKLGRYTFKKEVGLPIGKYNPILIGLYQN